MALQAASPDRCGVIWFMHIPKTGGGTIKAMIQNHSDTLNWKFFDLWRANAGGRCKDEVLSTPNLSHWKEHSKVKSVQNFFTELSQPRPRVVVHQHGCGPGILGSPPQGGLLTDLIRLNASLAQRGCEVFLTTVLRQPIALAKSRMAWFHVKASWPDSFVLERSARFYQTKFLVGKKGYPFMDKWLPSGLNERQWLYLHRNVTSTASCKEDMQIDALRSHFHLVGRTENLTAFAWELLMLMGGGSGNNMSAPSEWMGTQKHKSHAAAGFFTNTTQNTLERLLNSCEDMCIYSYSSSPTAFVPDLHGKTQASVAKCAEAACSFYE